ncbi:MAG: DUF47 family protein [Candidatus Nitrosocaldus sp.]|nr:DUF47 family protein [Candidatus Nitrosocaldus sp.]MDW8275415.1 DUF47 family protein [Candidatus Nitrosocaldus sp.]
MFYRKGSDIQDILLEHLSVVMDTLRSFKSMIDALIALDLEKGKGYLAMVDELETKADGVHRENVIKVCKGSFFAYMREDILTFMERVDDIADSAKEASRVLMIRKVPDDALLRFLNANTTAYIDGSMETVMRLIDLVNSLHEKREIILERVKRVEQSEESVDAMKSTVLHELYSNSTYDILTVIQLKEFIQLVDRIADSAEDASDVIILMLAKGYA